MPVPYFPTKKDGRHAREVNRLKVLKALRLFGHLRRQEVAAAVWPHSSAASAYIMACRTITLLLDEEMVLEKPNSLGGSSFVLAAKGVNALRSQDLVSQEGYTLASDGPQFFHRTLGTSYLLEKARGGYEVFGEYAVIKGMSPVRRDFLRDKFKKVPDGLIVYDSALMGLRNGVRSADWVEVESAYKTYDELEKSLSLLTKNSELNADGSLLLNKLVFVFDSRQKHDRPVLRAARQFLREHPNLTKEVVLAEIVLAKCFIAPPFAWQGMVEASALELDGKSHFEDNVTDDEMPF